MAGPSCWRIEKRDSQNVGQAVQSRRTSLTRLMQLNASLGPGLHQDCAAFQDYK